jgi:hypothetical protein
MFRKIVKFIKRIWCDDMLEMVGDFETTTNPDDVRVWASCLVDIDTLKVKHLGNNIEGMFEFLKNKNTRVFFHNLKFDGEFILHHVMAKMGYKHNDSKEGGTFQTLITDTGQFYQITVYFEKKNKRYKKVVFQDSLKKLPFKVEKIAKSFKLPIAKGSIDYNTPRAVGHELTEEEKEYIINDCMIVAQALKLQFAEGLTKMTIGSDSLSQFKESIGQAKFEKMFPVLPYLLDKEIRRAYKGGFTYVNPVFKDKRLQGICFDVNSLYPSVMRFCPMPWGFPIPFTGEYVPDVFYPLFIQRLSCEFVLKPGHIPCIQLKNNRAFIATHYLESSNGEIVDLTLTNVDLALFLEHYDVYNLEYILGYKFKSYSGIFNKFIDKWNGVKESSEGGIRELAKLRLNNLYGKFATNPESFTKSPYLSENGVVKYTVNDIELRDAVFTPVGAFITSYARDKTIRTAQALYSRFIYADTDSIYIVGPDVPIGLEIHPTHLGAWKFEGEFTDSKFLRAKTYMKTEAISIEEWDKLPPENQKKYQLNAPKMRYEHIEVKCAGMPDNVKELVNYDNFEVGSAFPGKLTPKRFAGGVVLTPCDFTIKR